MLENRRRRSGSDIARNRIRGPDVRRKFIGRLDQQRVACDMTQGIVDPFEIVEVNNRQRQPCPLATRARRGLFKSVDQ